MNLSLNQFLLLYSWFLIAALFFFLSLIARFYERFSGKRTYYRGFLVPVLLFGVFSVRYAGLDRLAGDRLADAALGIGGVVLLVLCWNLHRLMIVGTRRKG